MNSILKDSYARIEEATSAFSRATGIACPTGCGECCQSIDFPVSRAEAEEVAVYLLAHPELLARFESRPLVDPRILGSKVVCPLYDEATHCTVYPARPLLCRTFGFSAHRGKDGGTTYAPCHRFRDDPVMHARVEAVRVVREGQGPPLPILPDESLSVWAMDPSGSGLPIGPAVAEALERIRQRLEYSTGKP